MGRLPEPGDWVRTTRRLAVTWSDALTDGGLPAGTRGVVIDRTGRTIDVRFRSGLGTTRARVPAGGLALERRGGGQERFVEGSRRIAVVRVALATFLLFPLASFAGSYVWHNRTLDGIVPAFVVAATQSLGDWVTTAVDHPIQSLVYAGFLSLLGRIAFGHRRRGSRSRR